MLCRALMASRCMAFSLSTQLCFTTADSEMGSRTWTHWTLVALLYLFQLLYCWNFHASLGLWLPPVLFETNFTWRLPAPLLLVYWAVSLGSSCPIFFVGSEFAYQQMLHCL
jgi:hypothetical protein